MPRHQSIAPMVRPIGVLEAHARFYNEVAGNGRIRILDSTLREGEQHPGVSFTLEQRLEIARRLDAFGVAQIEIGPGVSPEHAAATKDLIREGLRADLVAHGRAELADLDVALDAGASWVAVYLSVSDLHLETKLRITREEALAKAIDAADYIRAHGLKARFTMEDASRADPEFLIEICRAVTDCGIERIGIPDTVGTLRPRGMYNLVRTVREGLGAAAPAIDVHCHNDMGLALANALAGCEAGADQIHASVEGYGERAGIPALAEVAVALALLYECNDGMKLDDLVGLSQLVSKYTGLPVPGSRPLVGADVYKHKAGTHVASVLRNPMAYEAVDPQIVGNHRRIVIGELSGKAGVAHLLDRLGLEVNPAEVELHRRVLKSLGRGDVFELSLEKRNTT